MCDDGKLQEAESVCLQGLIHHPELPTGQVALARAWLDAGKTAQAEMRLLDTIRQHPHHADAYRYLAKVMAVTDATNGKQVALVPIGEHPDAAAYDKKRGVVYSSNGEGSLSVIHQDSANHYSLVETVATQRGARTMALDEVNGNGLLVTLDPLTRIPSGPQYLAESREYLEKQKAKLVRVNTPRKLQAPPHRPQRRGPPC